MQLNDKYFLNPAHLDLARARYFLKDENGAAVEQDIDEVFCRTVGHIYQDDKEHEQEALKYRREKKIIDAGRVLAQSGTKVSNLLNCFVIGFEDDTREAISELKRKHFSIQAQGGGTGINFSALRPNGSVCKTTQSRSSGAVGFITDFSYQSSNTSQGGNRSGANMGILEDWHPDLYEFITKKSESNWENIRKFATIYNEDEFSYFQWAQPYPWQMFNVSVFVSDKLMKMVESGGKDPWILSWNGEPWHLWEFKNTKGPQTRSDYAKTFTVTAPNYEMALYKASSHIPYFSTENLELVRGPFDLTAEEWFTMICKNAWEDGCPGIIFVDQGRKFHNAEYFNKLEATNPCVSKDTWVLTNNGPRQVADLIDKPFTAIVDGRAYKSDTGFFKTGDKEVVSLALKCGTSLKLTRNHRVLTINGGKKIWKEAGELKCGETVVINNHKEFGFWPGSGNFDNGYLMGLLVGDGHITGKKAVLSTWDKDVGVDGVRERALKAAMSLKHRSDFSGWLNVLGRDEKRLVLKELYNLAKSYDIDITKQISKKIEMASSDFYAGFLRGFFDADGSVQGNLKKGISIRLWQADLERLNAVQRMLLRMGIKSRIYKNRKMERIEFIKGKDYTCKLAHELCISNESIIRFKDLIGFSNNNKNEKLNGLVSSYKRSPNTDKFSSKVKSITGCGIEDVYDVTVNDIHAFDANGIYVHNCAEQILPRNSVCCLTSLILPSFYVDGKFMWDDFGRAIYQAVRGLDNIISLSRTGETDIDKNSLRERRIGLGTTGIGELLIMAGLKYSSQEGRDFVEKILEFLRDKAYESSVELVKERGSFPEFNYEGLAKSAFIKSLPKRIRDLIKEFGLRNVTILTQAPVGTTGTMQGFSTGCEPNFAMCFRRNSRVGVILDGSPAFIKWLSDNNLNFADYNYNLKTLRESIKVPGYFEEANEISWEDHIRMQAVFAKYVDSSVSKTVNLPNSATIEDVKGAYKMAYDLGIKSTTIYRDGAKKQVLEHIIESTKTNRPSDIVRAHAPKRPSELLCDIHHTSIKGEKWTVLVGLLESRPYEVFCAPQESFEIGNKYKSGKIVKNGGGSYYLDTGDFKIKNLSSYLKNDEHRVITRLLSTCLRHGVPMPFISEQLTKADGTIVDFSKAILRVLKKYGDNDAVLDKDLVCAVCGSSNVVVNSGCPECLDCGVSKCG